MKTKKYFLIILSLLMAFVGCSDDLENITFDPNNADPGELLAIGDSYVLEATQIQEVMATFKWGKMDMGVSSSIEYTLEADLAGNNFVNAKEITNTPSLTADITVGAMNKTMMDLQKIYEFEDETEQLVEFRIKGFISVAATPIYTNVITSKITPYPAEVEYPKMRLVGDYCGWSHVTAQGLFAFEGGTLYEGWVKLDGKGINGFKVSESVLDWNEPGLGNWGLKDGESVDEEPKSISLWNDGGSKDIKALKGIYYRLSFDKGTSVLSVLKTMTSFGIVGDATPNGWDGPDMVMDFDTKKQVFTALVDLKKGDIKFRADNNFDFNYGGSNGVLSEGGDNIAIEVEGTYKITVDANNPNDLKYKIETGTPIDPSLITPQVLDAIGNFELPKSQNKSFSWSALGFGAQEPAKVNYKVEMDLKGANFANAQTLGTTIETSITISGNSLLAALKALDASTDINVEKEIEVRVVAEVSGLETPFISNLETAKVKVVEDPQYPTTLFMTGDEFGNWFGDLDNVVELTPVNGVAGAFWTIKYFTAGKAFKWAPKKEWNGDFNQLEESIGFEIDGGNAKVTTSGLYMVYVDMATKKIKFEEPQVYGIGDAFGGWNEETYKFSIESNQITFSPTKVSNELRMYAVSSISTVSKADWWKMEFILRDGKIEYRGNGGDQNPRVAVEAGKKITLDFTANTGTIK